MGAVALFLLFAHQAQGDGSGAVAARFFDRGLGGVELCFGLDRCFGRA